HAALQALKHHAADPAAAVIFDADHGVHQLAVLQAVVEAPHAIPPPATLAPTRTQVLALVAPQVVERPLPADVDLLAGVPLKTVGGTHGVVAAGAVARRDGRADGVTRLGVVLHGGVKTPLRRPVDA